MDPQANPPDQGQQFSLPSSCLPCPSVPCTDSTRTGYTISFFGFRNTTGSGGNSDCGFGFVDDLDDLVWEGDPAVYDPIVREGEIDPNSSGWGLNPGDPVWAEFDPTAACVTAGLKVSAINVRFYSQDPAINPASLIYDTFFNFDFEGGDSENTNVTCDNAVAKTVTATLTYLESTDERADCRPDCDHCKIPDDAVKSIRSPNQPIGTGVPTDPADSREIMIGTSYRKEEDNQCQVTVLQSGFGLGDTEEKVRYVTGQGWTIGNSGAPFDFTAHYPGEGDCCSIKDVLFSNGLNPTNYFWVDIDCTAAEVDEGQDYALPDTCYDCCGLEKRVNDDYGITMRMRPEVFKNFKLYLPNGTGDDYELLAEQFGDAMRWSLGEPCSIAIPLNNCKYVKLTLDNQTGEFVAEYTGAPELRSDVVDPPTVEGSNTVFSTVSLPDTDYYWKGEFDIDDQEPDDSCQGVICCSFFKFNSQPPITFARFFAESDIFQSPGQDRVREAFYDMSTMYRDPAFPDNDCRWIMETVVSPTQSNPGEKGPDIPVIFSEAGWSFEWAYAPDAFGGYFYPGLSVNWTEGEGLVGIGGTGAGGFNRRASVEFTVSGSSGCLDNGVCLSDQDMQLPQVFVGPSSTASFSFEPALSNPGGAYEGTIAGAVTYQGDGVMRGVAGTLTLRSAGFPSPPLDPATYPADYPDSVCGIAISMVNIGGSNKWRLNYRAYNAYVATDGSGNGSFETDALSPGSYNGTFDLKSFGTVVGTLTISGVEEGCEGAPLSMIPEAKPERSAAPIGLGRRFRKINPKYFKGSSCGNCEDVVRLLDRYGPEKMLEGDNVERFAKTIASIRDSDQDEVKEALVKAIMEQLDDETN